MALEAGQKAPDFSVQDQDGITRTLKDYLGQKVALYFYGQDNTPTCTNQACNLRDNYQDIQKAGYTVLGVSVDSVKKHKNFVTKFSLPFTLLADVNHEIVNAYQVWQEKTTFGHTYMGAVRTTFLIDEKGNIERIIDKVTSSDHARQILG